MHKPYYTVVHREREFVLIFDNDGPVSITNAAECVVCEMLSNGRLFPGQRLFYRDTDGQVDELAHDGIKFTGFAFGGPGSPRGQRNAVQASSRVQP